MSNDYTQEPFFAVIQQMIAEQGATAWIHAEGVDRSQMSGAVVVTDSPARCFRLVCPDPAKPEVWHIHRDVLGSHELADFFAAFGNHWAVLLGAKVGPNLPVRAFISNGRRGGRRWSVSVGACLVPEAPSIFTVDKTKQRICFDNETESQVTILVEDIT